MQITGIPISALVPPVLRGAVAAFAGLAILGCAAVLEAAVKTDMALKGATAAQLAHDPAARLEGLNAAAELLQESWASPLDWHAGADEALSYIAAAIAAQTRDPAFDRLAVTAATRSVDLSPVQPAGWARLAAFGQAGRRVERCDVPACLARSWRAASIADAGIECARMRLARRIGQLPPGDPRFDALDQSMLITRDFARCLAFLPRAELFQVLLKRAARNHSEALERAESVRR